MEIVFFRSMKQFLANICTFKKKTRSIAIKFRSTPVRKRNFRTPCNYRSIDLHTDVKVGAVFYNLYELTGESV